MSVDIDALRQKQAQGLTVGVVPTSGSPAIRLEIDDFIQDTELANLYFLACEAYAAKPIYKDPFSYYEISGIHGQPARPWDGVASVDFPPTDPDPNAYIAPGYCSHGSVLFPMWHRAYLAQFEQAMFLHAADIAPKLNAQAVLNRFRIPYFDPMLPRQRTAGGQGYRYGIPIIFTLPTIQVRRPENPNTWTSMANPLYKFDFPNDDNPVQISWDAFEASSKPVVENAVKQNTIRGYDGTTPNANHTYVIQTFDGSYNPVTARSSDAAGRLWHVMFDNQNYVTMSNHFMPRNRPQQIYNANSLEGFHDDIHTFLGKGPNSRATSTGQVFPYGHMAYPELAGFDPSFWLHHCNIDRLLSIWQGIHSNNPDSQKWWTSLFNADGTFVEPAGENETPSTPLAPFRKAVSGSNTTWWTSNDLKDTRTIGYDYPQVAAARQSGNLVQGLVAWANAELGWADPSHFKQKPGDQGALDHFVKEQIPRPVPSFPSRVLVDGTTPLPTGTDYISSGAPKTTNGGPVANIAAAASTAVAHTAAAAQRVLKGGAPPTHPSFSARFGDLGSLVTPSRKMTQWHATFGVEKYALSGPFMIHFFLGDFSPSPDAVWLHDRNRAGTSGIFASSSSTLAAGHCSNCNSSATANSKYYDTVGLTPALLSYVRSGEECCGHTLPNLEREAVVPFLTRNLHWRVVNMAGEEVPRDQVAGLRVGVYSESVVLPGEVTEVPRFEDKVMHYQVTEGRPGGLGQGEQL